MVIQKSKDDPKDLFYSFELTNNTLSKTSGCFDPCNNFITNKKNMELRLHNRGSEDIVLDPDEEIGIIEKFTTEQVVQAYDLTTDQHLCVMEDTRESEPEPDETLLNNEDYEKN
ncbi:hypothetical protein G6F56_012587 [Rhizopus delemar]|nr:hypothetical protein G6F56_012587 [Rhizopus delemar]